MTVVAAVMEAAAQVEAERVTVEAKAPAEAAMAEEVVGTAVRRKGSTSRRGAS